jgi:D-methionine transport system substrate-binding protein
MRLMRIVLVMLAALLINACSPKQEAANEIKVGTISGPETQLMQVAQQVAQQKYGLKVSIVEFTDYNLPNQALADGSIDINMFQHQPYLTASINAHQYNIVPVAKTFIYPMGIYSQKITRLSALSKNAIVGIPNDPTNEARALLLLQKARLIQLAPHVSITATPQDIIKNSKKLQFKELDAAQLPRVLPDVDIAVINSNYALAAGLNPKKHGKKVSSQDAIYLEGKDSNYANLFVVRTADKDNPKVKQLINAFQSPEVLVAAQGIFNGDAIKAW